MQYKHIWSICGTEHRFECKMEVSNNTNNHIIVKYKSALEFIFRASLIYIYLWCYRSSNQIRYNQSLIFYNIYCMFHQECFKMCYYVQVVFLTLVININAKRRALFGKFFGTLTKRNHALVKKKHGNILLKCRNIKIFMIRPTYLS